MNSNPVVTASLWDNVVTDQDAVERHQLITKAKVALAGTWPFLAAARSEGELEHRIALVSEQIERRAPEPIRTEVLAGLRADWKTLHEARTAEAQLTRTAALTIEAAENGELPKAYVHVHKHGSGDDEYYQVDHVASPSFLNTLGHLDSRDEALSVARQYGLPNGLPIYENGRYVEGRRHRALFADDEEFFDAKTGSWVQSSALPNTLVQKHTAGVDDNGHLVHPSGVVRGHEVQHDDGWHEVTHILDNADGSTVLTLGDGAKKVVGPNEQVRTRRRHASVTATNYRPDPDMGWRYRYGPQTAQAPGLGGETTAPQVGAPAAAGGQVAQTSTDPTDGFPADVTDGEDRSVAAYERMTTPGVWSVPPNANWPADTRPNAATGLPIGQFPTQNNAGWASQSPVRTTGSRHIAGGEEGTSDDFYSYGGRDGNAKCPDCGSNRAEEHRWEQNGHPMLSRSCPDCGSAATVRVGRRADAAVNQQYAPANTPNPGYFDQGTQGLAGPPTFPTDPAVGIEPWVGRDPVEDGQYGPPPPVSPGSAQGQVDGAGYSRQAKVRHDYPWGYPHMTVHPIEPGIEPPLHEVRLHEGPGASFTVGYWPSATVLDNATAYGHDYLSAQGHRAADLPIHAVTASRQVQAEYHYVHQRGDKWVVTQKDTGKVLSEHDSKEDAEASFRAMMMHKHEGSRGRLGFSRSAAAQLDTERCGICGARLVRHEGYPEQGIADDSYLARHYDENGSSTHGTFGDRDFHNHRPAEIHPPVSNPSVHTFGSTAEAYDTAMTSGHVRDGDVLHVPDEGVTGYLYQAWPMAVVHPGDPGEFHTFTNGAHEPSAYEDRGRYGESVRRAFDVAHQRQAATRSARERNPYRVDPETRSIWEKGFQTGRGIGSFSEDDLGVEDPHTGREYSAPAHHYDAFWDGHAAGEAMATGRPKTDLLAEYQQRRRYAARTAATDGRIVGFCDHCSTPVRYHDDGGGGELRHLHNGSARCSDGKHVATASRTPQFFDPHQAAVLEQPTPENPTGRGGDEYRARNWDALTKQRPMQTPDQRNVNTPVLPEERPPARQINTPTPGLEEPGGTRAGEDDDDDDDEE